MSAGVEKRPAKVVVLGAGTAGLACAQSLQEGGGDSIEVVVLEARKRVGGRVLTHWFADGSDDPDPVEPPAVALEDLAPPSAACVAPRTEEKVCGGVNANADADAEADSEVQADARADARADADANAGAHVSVMVGAAVKGRKLRRSTRSAAIAAAASSTALKTPKKRKRVTMSRFPKPLAQHSQSTSPLSLSRQILDMLKPTLETAIPFHSLPPDSVLEDVNDGILTLSASQHAFRVTPGTAVPFSKRPFPSFPEPLSHNFRDLVSGNVTAPRVSQSGTQKVSVDIGASVMHGCGDDNQYVFERAIKDKIRAPVVAGGASYENTDIAMWFNEKSGGRVPTKTVVEMHNIFSMASRVMGILAFANNDRDENMRRTFNFALEYVLERLNNRVLTSVEAELIQSICARSYGYCAPMSEMALDQASSNVTESTLHIHIGAQLEEDELPAPGLIPRMDALHLGREVKAYESDIRKSRRPKIPIASRRGGDGDRIVVDGYTPFLIDRLQVGVDVRLEKSACIVRLCDRFRSGRGSRREPRDSVEDETIDGSDSCSQGEVCAATQYDLVGARGETPSSDLRMPVMVRTRDGDSFECDFVVVTLPLGVLKGRHPKSEVTFCPSLSEAKQEAIQSMGMGVHNKVVLRFRERDVFWPPTTPQLNCLDSRFQFFNLHAYGKAGVILVHVFAESGYAHNYWGASTDAEVVAEVLSVLAGMFSMTLRRMSNFLCMHCSSEMHVSGMAGDGSAGCNKAAQDFTSREVCDCCGGPLTASPSPIFRSKSDAPQRPRRSTRTTSSSTVGGGSGGVRARNDDATNTARCRVSRHAVPAPMEYIVTRWDTDPYSLGSYSWLPCGADWAMIDALGKPEPNGDAVPRLFFAGEHCSDLGWQCVHGAYETGIKAAKDILQLCNLSGDAKNSEKRVNGNSKRGGMLKSSANKAKRTQKKPRVVGKSAVDNARTRAGQDEAETMNGTQSRVGAAHRDGLCVQNERQPRPKYASTMKPAPTAGKNRKVSDMPLNSTRSPLLLSIPRISELNHDRGRRNGATLGAQS